MENLALVFNKCKEKAANGCTVALYQLGDMYEHGHGCEQSDALAIAFYINAGQLGEKRALSKLAHIYENGGGLLQYDKQVAILFYQSAVCGVKEMQTALALMYEKGRGVVQNYQHAIEWYKKSAVQGDIYAHFTLAAIYQDGRGVTPDKNLVEHYLLQALAVNSQEAKFRLSFFYDEIGKHKKAFDYYQLVCESDPKLAHLRITEPYHEGLDINLLLLQARWLRAS